MLSINVSELILTFVSFFVFMILLRRVLFEPVLKFMDARQARIDADLAAAQAADDRLAGDRADREKALAETRSQAQAQQAAGRKEDLAALEAAQRQLRDHQQQLQDRLQQDNLALLEKSGEELRAEAPELSRTLADRLLGK